MERRREIDYKASYCRQVRTCFKMSLGIGGLVLKKLKYFVSVSEWCKSVQTISVLHHREMIICKNHLLKDLRACVCLEVVGRWGKLTNRLPNRDLIKWLCIWARLYSPGIVCFGYKSPKIWFCPSLFICFRVWDLSERVRLTQHGGWSFSVYSAEKKWKW